MRFCSTRGGIDPVPLDAALVAGLAPDGGLYVPERVPALASTAPAASLAEMAERVLAPYAAGSVLESRLPSLCAEAFAFDAPLRALAGEGDFVLELFHGPTAAFKDYAARFLAAALSALREANGASTGATTILVATSGDTGAAVASAFHRRDGFEVVVLYPDGRVSPRQAHGLGCWGDNVRAFRVAGSFDDCQRMAKQALSDAALRARLPLTSANSISLGRLLPQAAYYAQAATTHFAANGEALGFIVPTGNLGNACACLLAWRMGAPIRGIHLATNANDVLPRYFAGEEYAPRATVATLANAMDVGAPSNFERLRYWHGSDDALRTALRATCVDDEAIAAAIRRAPQRHGILPCPHTAAALHVLEHLRAEGDTRAWAVVATAHPAKFERIVEPLVGREVPVPPQLAACLTRPAAAERLAPDMGALADALLRGAKADARSPRAARE